MTLDKIKNNNKLYDSKKDKFFILNKKNNYIFNFVNLVKSNVENTDNRVLFVASDKFIRQKPFREIIKHCYWIMPLGKLEEVEINDNLFLYCFEKNFIGYTELRLMDQE